MRMVTLSEFFEAIVSRGFRLVVFEAVTAIGVVAAVVVSCWGSTSARDRRPTAARSAGMRPPRHPSQVRMRTVRRTETCEASQLRPTIRSPVILPSLQRASRGSLQPRIRPLRMPFGNNKVSVIEEQNASVARDTLSGTSFRSRPISRPDLLPLPHADRPRWLA